MKIETKANIGDEVFFMHENKVTSDTVIDISINVIEQKNLYNYTTVTTIVYNTKRLLKILEENAFLSKQELLESLWASFIPN